MAWSGVDEWWNGVVEWSAVVMEWNGSWDGEEWSRRAELMSGVVKRKGVAEWSGVEWSSDME